MSTSDRERREAIIAGDESLRFPPRIVPLDTAISYFRLGFSPIPLCDPEHKHVWRTHREHCTSPGKAPITPGWPRYANDTMTEEDVRQLFQGHRGNVGLALRPGQFVLDVDARSGGIVSLEVLQATHGTLPDTPQVFTGGGGQHWYFSLPLDSKIPSGGTLTSIGFSGVEWKTHTERGGQVVAPPSVHASGTPYIWEVSSPIETTPLAPVPVWLLSLIQQAVDTDTPRDPNVPQGDGTGKVRYSKDQVVGFFRRTYSEGERRVQSTGLPRLIGILKSRNVPAHRTVAYIKWWQQDHFTPPLSDEAIEGTVKGMYGRYGHPEEAQAADGEKFLRYLHTVLTAPAPDTNVVNRDSAYSDTIPIDDISGSTADAKDPLASSAEANDYDMDIFKKWSLRSMDLLPRPEGMPELVYTIAKLKDRVAAIERQSYSNTWRNPVNAAVKRQRLYSHLMTKMEMQGLTTIYKIEMASDDWDPKRHQALMTKARRLGHNFFWVDNRLYRNSFVYFFSGDMPGAEPVEGLENISAEISLHIADIDPPEPGTQDGRFRPAGMSKDWKLKRPEDKNKADFIGWRHNVDDEFEVQQCEEQGIATWTTEGDPVFEAGTRRFFALGKQAAADIGEMWSGPAGQWMRLIGFIHNKLGYVLTAEAYAEAYPGQENPNKRSKRKVDYAGVDARIANAKPGIADR